MNITDVIVIGEDIIGLYTAIRASEKGYNVKIFEKKNKTYFSNHDKIVFSEQQHFMKKLMSKLGVPLEIIEYNVDGLSFIIKISIKCLQLYKIILCSHHATFYLKVM